MSFFTLINENTGRDNGCGFDIFPCPVGESACFKTTFQDGRHSSTLCLIQTDVSNIRPELEEIKGLVTRLVAKIDSRDEENLLLRAENRELKSRLSA